MIYSEIKAKAPSVLNELGFQVLKIRGKIRETPSSSPRGPDEPRDPSWGADYHHPVASHYKLGDILANAITHGVGAILAIVGAVYLIAASARRDAWVVVGCTVFAVTLVLVYICSTLYHSLVRTRARHVFQVLDHSAIYLLIAGTYTPFTLVSLRGPVGWTMFALVWSLAIAGVIFKSFAVDRFAVGVPRLSTCFRAGSSSSRSGRSSTPSAGMASYGSPPADWLTPSASSSSPSTACATFTPSGILFVLAGSIAHYFAILFYVIPPRS